MNEQTTIPAKAKDSPVSSSDELAAVRHVVAFSGGAASAVVAEIVTKEHPDTTTLLFHDTRTEPADNYRFRKEVAARIGLPITGASDGRDIWAVFQDERFLGNSRIAPCSKLLKQVPGRRWMREHAPCVAYYGFTADEWRRAQRTAARLESDIGTPCRFPLIERGIGKQDCLDIVTKCWGLRLPEMYTWAEHANCVPCIRGGMTYWGLVYLHAPDAWRRAAEAEKAADQSILKDGRLPEMLSRCQELARRRIAQDAADAAQGVLFEVPCECMA